MIERSIGRKSVLDQFVCTMALSTLLYDTATRFIWCGSSAKLQINSTTAKSINSMYMYMYSAHLVSWRKSISHRTRTQHRRASKFHTLRSFSTLKTMEWSSALRPAQNRPKSIPWSCAGRNIAKIRRVETGLTVSTAETSPLSNKETNSSWAAKILPCQGNKHSDVRLCHGPRTKLFPLKMRLGSRHRTRYYSV